MAERSTSRRRKARLADLIALRVAGFADTHVYPEGVMPLTEGHSLLQRMRKVKAKKRV